MSDHLAAERANIYDTFYEVSDGLEVEFDAEEVLLYSDHEAEIDKTVSKIKDTYFQGEMGTDLSHIKIIAAIAFCDRADFDVYDYEGWGGEKYEDD
jgi:hypothetical protein